MWVGTRVLSCTPTPLFFHSPVSSTLSEPCPPPCGASFSSPLFHSSVRFAGLLRWPSDLTARRVSGGGGLGGCCEDGGARCTQLWLCSSPFSELSGAVCGGLGLAVILRVRRAPNSTLLSPPEGGGGFNVSYPALTRIRAVLSGMERPSCCHLAKKSNHKPTLSLLERVASERKQNKEF